MKVSYKWLKEYIDITLSTEELAEKLTMAGIEVEAIHRTAEIPSGVVVGEILERKPHPDADKLSVCMVNSGKETLQVVCGAPNCDAGKKVPLATLGTVFTDPENGKKFEIKKCKLRGVESSGMLCSSKELGVDDDHAGLMELSKDLETGKPVKELFTPDVVFELEITSNRPDWLSHYGIARDIAALTGAELKFSEIKLPAPTKDAAIPANLVEVLDHELCPRYTALVIKNITVGESPDWLKERLISIGLRPINNIVDITNFVLMELGHPLHAFDLDDLAGKRIVVRRARNGEKIMTLDGKTHELKDHHLVIADAEKPVALAGIMGGEHSGVTEKTCNILIEGAYFKPSNIRTTSKELEITSDSSHRFERGTSWEAAETAAKRTASLVLELAGGELVTGLIDVRGELSENKSFDCHFDMIRRLTGMTIANHDIIAIFERLGIKCTEIEDDKCRITAPHFRLDIEREADLAEEIARINGLDNIPVIPVAAKTVASIKDDAYMDLSILNDELIALGLWECMNYTLTDEKSALADTRFSKDDLILLTNPVSIDLAFLRPSLYGGILRNVEYNVSRQNHDLALFETGRAFCANAKLFKEERYECCIALSGRRYPERFSVERELENDFFDMKGLLEELLSKIKVKDIRFVRKEEAIFAKGCCAELFSGNARLGIFGKVDEKIEKQMRLRHPLYVALLEAEQLIALGKDKITYKQLALYPSTSRDVAFIAEQSLEHQAVTDFIMKCGVKNLEKVELFDIFEDEKTLGAGKKSMAYSLTFRNPEKTLTDEEVNQAHEKLRERLASGLKVDLR
ncbi:MAG: phenylalanine--tRNA ligase subunit beta [Lentisphaerae bacterium GWF2_45_14]|nr:MAG: phenylalanine--tRNA ligase subunit beta [Lentisphaerae bacterium GWF2_45_14]